MGFSERFIRYLNKRRSKRLTFPTPPSRTNPGHFSLLDSSALGDCLDNLQQFLSACITCGVVDDDLFELEDLLLASNESLARVAGTVVALSAINKKRHNSAGTEPNSKDLVSAATADQVSLREFCSVSQSNTQTQPDHAFHNNKKVNDRGAFNWRCNLGKRARKMIQDA